ncbi:hypothetical protein CLV63_102206 [Murinocardiopsis flavida]|uniref:Uncharacterized protein n=1 Tax=Murinocardiopsis flavida TaxID=645275 RepID=A0A2P8DS94_9ACTN|nr:hypothetical protein [Murinocardiopsis flavida]PSL00080.1 hypothetical protein CLV63_102206 [Murinocardiopsis flavida]
MSQLVRSLAGGRAGAEGRRTGAAAGPAAAIVERHAPVAAVIDRFHRRLLTESKHASYPAAEIARACAPTIAAR